MVLHGLHIESVLHLPRSPGRPLAALPPADLLHALLARLLLLERLALTRDVAAVALGQHVLAQALMVSRAMMLAPMAAWIAVNIWREMISRIFGGHGATAVLALATVHDDGQRIHLPPLSGMSTFTTSDGRYS